jgi:hypothetical protein
MRADPIRLGVSRRGAFAANDLANCLPRTKVCEKARERNADALKAPECKPAQIPRRIALVAAGAGSHFNCAEFAVDGVAAPFQLDRFDHDLREGFRLREPQTEGGGLWFGLLVGNDQSRSVGANSNDGKNRACTHDSAHCSGDRGAERVESHPI